MEYVYMITIIKRNGRTEPLDITKIQKYTSAAVKDLSNVSQSELEVDAQIHFRDGITSQEIQQTLKDVLISNNITKDSVIKQHQSILSQAIEVNQLSTAEKCNTKFMQLLGIDSFQPSKQTNIQINIDKMSNEDINDKLKDIITL